MNDIDSAMPTEPDKWMPPFCIDILISSADDLRGCRAMLENIAAQHKTLIDDTRKYCAMMPAEKGQRAIETRNNIIRDYTNDLLAKYTIVMAKRAKNGVRK